MGKLGLLLGLVNTIVIAAVLGLFVYTKVIYKHPPITESQERAKLARTEHKSEIVHSQKKGIVQLDAITTNLDPYLDADGKQKLHYISVSLAVEIRDEKEISKFELIKPIVLDQVLQQLGKKKI